MYIFLMNFTIISTVFSLVVLVKDRSDGYYRKQDMHRDRMPILKSPNDFRQKCYGE